MESPTAADMLGEGERARRRRAGETRQLCAHVAAHSVSLQPRLSSPTPSVHLPLQLGPLHAERAACSAVVIGESQRRPPWIQRAERRPIIATQSGASSSHRGSLRSTHSHPAAYSLHAIMALARLRAGPGRCTATAAAAAIARTASCTPAASASKRWISGRTVHVAPQTAQPGDKHANTAAWRRAAALERQTVSESGPRSSDSCVASLDIARLVASSLLLHSGAIASCSCGRAASCQPQDSPAARMVSNSDNERALLLSPCC